MCYSGTGEVDEGAVPRAALTSAFIEKLQTPVLSDPMDANSEIAITEEGKFARHARDCTPVRSHALAP